MTVSQVMGCGIQRGYKEIVRGMEVDLQMQPKIKFEIVVSSEEWEKKTVDAIRKSAFTGENGDGKIFCYEIKEVYKIRTDETGLRRHPGDRLKANSPPACPIIL